jgi:hypothetical protein
MRSQLGHCTKAVPRNTRTLMFGGTVMKHA